MQVIPYIVLKCEDKYFVTKRLDGDHRLVGMIGFLGGHIDKSDLVLKERNIDPFMTIYNGAIRELKEEVGVDITKYRTTLTNVFNDTSNDVSKVHICALMVVDVDANDMESVKVLETEKLEGLWLDINELGEYSAKDKMENWAVITYEKLKELYPPVEEPKKKQTRKTKVTKEEK